jgi:arrestin-related trafficking adapter 1
MPHKVTTFLKFSTTSLETQVAGLKKAAKSSKKRTLPGQSGQGRYLSRASPLASRSDSDNDDAATLRSMASDSGSRASSVSSDVRGDHQQHHHRISFPGLHAKARSSSKDAQARLPASLDWKVESPPIIFYGDAENSSGALVSGQLFLTIKEDVLDVESFTGTLHIHVHQKRPFTAHCHECTNQYTELHKWTFLQQPTPLNRGEHSYPFSVLMHGHLPSSMDTPLMSIVYEFKAEAVLKPAAGSLSPAPIIRFERHLDVKRSLVASDLPHHSVRIFPPTNIKASVHYPQVIYPTGSNTFSLRLDGIAKHNQGVNTIEFWKLKKLMWRLEETIKTVAPACDKHVPRDPKDPQGAQAAPKKGVQRVETRVIGEKTLFSGWKSDYSSMGDSSVEIELEYMLGKHARYLCDMKSRDGSEVSHQLMVEMVVSQEWAPANKLNYVTQTGIGRILRMHFCSMLTERGGIGISWDNESPPIYQDVPPSPPSYCEETRLASEPAIDENIELLDGIPRPGSGQGRRSLETTNPPHLSREAVNSLRDVLDSDD